MLISFREGSNINNVCCSLYPGIILAIKLYPKWTFLAENVYLPREGHTKIYLILTWKSWLMSRLNTSYHDVPNLSSIGKCLGCGAV